MSPLSPAPDLEFRIPISPSPAFYSNVRLAALSLARLGPPYSTARILVSVGDYADITQVRRENGWSEDFPIEWRAVAFGDFEERNVFATGDDRYSESSRAKIIVLCDADLCVLRRLDTLIETLTVGTPSIAGLQAHYFTLGKTASGNEELWRRLFAEADLPPPELCQRYSLDHEGCLGLGPPYFNYGLVAFNTMGFERIRPLISRYSRRAAAALGYQQFFLSQIALTLAVAASRLQVHYLSHAQHCANDERVFKNGLQSVDDIQAIHYLRHDAFDRHRFLVDRREFERFLSAPDLDRISQRLRQHVIDLGNAFMES